MGHGEVGWVGVCLIHDIPKLPDALPKFKMKTTIEVTREDGGKKLYAKEVEIDLTK